MGNQKGMTLVELMVAIVIISLALITMLDMFDLGISTTSQAEKETKALFLAQQKIEEVKNSSNPHSYETASPETFPEPDQDFTYEIIIDDLENNVIQIEVKVNYDSDNVVLVTRIGDKI